MSEKAQSSRKDEANSKPSSPQSTTQGSDSVAEERNHPATIVQRAKLDPNSLRLHDVLQLQRALGNQTVGQLLAQTTRHQPVQKAKNRTGLPDDLKSGIENLSGYAMDDVKVHYNSDKPAQLHAHAYAQGTDIHLASGQEKHLPHEAWHLVQQKQGRVKPTMQMNGKVKINDDVRLEMEADHMGKKATKISEEDVNNTHIKLLETVNTSKTVAQRQVIELPANNLTLNITDLKAEKIDEQSVGLSPTHRVCNAAYMQFSGKYTLTNNSGAERNISIGLIQNGYLDNVIGTYVKDEHSVQISFGRQDLPFRDGDDDTFPYYNADAMRLHNNFESGEIVEGELVIRDRPIIAIPHTITSPNGDTYTSTSLKGFRGLRIWLGIVENGNLIETIPICTWIVNSRDGTVQTSSGAGQPVV